MDDKKENWKKVMLKKINNKNCGIMLYIVGEEKYEKKY